MSMTGVMRKKMESMSRTSTILPNVRPFCSAFIPRSSSEGGMIAQRDKPDVALASFQKVIDKDIEASTQTDFGFKALKQMTKLTFRNSRYDEALSYYKRLLPYTKKGVTRNVAEKSINGILDYVSADAKLDTAKMQEFYEVTMKALEDAKNEVRFAACPIVTVHCN